MLDNRAVIASNHINARGPTRITFPDEINAKYRPKLSPTLPSAITIMHNNSVTKLSHNGKTIGPDSIIIYFQFYFPKKNTFQNIQ